MTFKIKKTCSIFRRKSLFVPVAALSCVSAVAVAQEPVLEETVVTARKRAESIQDVPIAITAFSGDNLEAKGALNIESVADSVPNLSITTGNVGSGSTANASIFMRGIGQADFLITTDPGVGLYIDGVYFARGSGTNLDLVDIGVMEILKGPQGTLFGKNTLGGAVSINSSRPSEELNGSVQVIAGDDDLLEGKLVVDVPITENILSRYSVIAKTQDGYVKRAAGGNLGDEEVFGGRATFLWTPSDAGEVTIIADAIDRDATSAPNALLEYDPTTPLAGIWQALVGDPNGVDAPAIVNKDRLFHSTGTGPNVDDATSWGLSATVEWDFDAFTFKSITAYRDLEAEFGRDGDNSPVKYSETHNIVEQDQLSQEFQFLGTAFDDRLDWVLGAYYFEEDAVDTNDVSLAHGLYGALEGLDFQLGGAPCGEPWVAPGCEGNPINTGLDIDLDIYNEISNKSVALFAHMSYALTDDWSLTGGLRYADEEKEYFLLHQRINAGVPVIPATKVADDWQEVLPLVTLDYQLNDTSMVYVSASKGFKSGGYNGRPLSAVAVESYEPEYLWSYELGYKADFWDGKGRLSSAVFYYDYEDIQLTSITADDAGAPLDVLENGGTAISKGFELEVQILPTDRWDITAGFAYLDSKYDELNPGVTVTKDSELQFSPEITAALGVAYSIPVFERFFLTTRADASYTDDHFTDVPNTPGIEYKAQTLVNARMSLMDKDERWEFAVFITNLTDETYFVSGSTNLESIGTLEANIAAERRFGASLKFNF